MTLGKLDAQTGTLKYLLLLYKSEKSELYNQDFLNAGMNDRTVKGARKVLAKVNLITIEERKVNNRNRLYSILTERGKLVARHLLEIDNILDEEQEKRYDYLLFELMYHSLSSIDSFLAHSFRSIPTKLSNTILSITTSDFRRKISNETLIPNYCREWEFQYGNLIKPIFTKIKDQGRLPRRYRNRSKFNYQTQIDVVREFARNSLNSDIFDFLTDSLDARLRNSLVHYNYYFDKNGLELVYYNKYRGTIRIERLPIKDFELKVFRLLAHRNIATVRIAKKFSQELGLEWKKRD